MPPVYDGALMRGLTVFGVGGRVVSVVRRFRFLGGVLSPVDRGGWLLVVVASRATTEVSQVLFRLSRWENLEHAEEI